MKLAAVCRSDERKHFSTNSCVRWVGHTISDLRKTNKITQYTKFPCVRGSSPEKWLLINTWLLPFCWFAWHAPFCVSHENKYHCMNNANVSVLISTSIIIYLEHSIAVALNDITQRRQAILRYEIVAPDILQVQVKYHRFDIMLYIIQSCSMFMFCVFFLLLMNVDRWRPPQFVSIHPILWGKDKEWERRYVW